MNVEDYRNAVNDAISREDHISAKRICRDAIRIFERIGENKEASHACHTLGMIFYEQGQLDEARYWYRKSLSIDDKIGDNTSLNFARSCHNLGAVENALGNYEIAEDLYQRSLQIKELQGDTWGIAATYHQLGVLAEAKSDFESAKRFFLASLGIKEELFNLQGVVGTLICLSGVDRLRGDNVSSKAWYHQALTRLDEGNPALAISIAKELERNDKYEDARDVYEKALEIAGRLGDEAGQSLILFRLGSLAYKFDDYLNARTYFEKSVEIDQRHRMLSQISESSYYLGRMSLLGAAKGERDIRKARYWFRRSLESVPTLSWRKQLVRYGYLFYCNLLSMRYPK